MLHKDLRQGVEGVDEKGVDVEKGLSTPLFGTYQDVVYTFYTCLHPFSFY
ncbi:hypothetical protein H6F88_17995 [Oculatella sp. FACHB-28]|nr:hypothetical protein [Oculatella sp. FACHB-28]MBD2057888.1 hypothetical protein [Oculatella sp. FACHB-28]